MRLQSNNNPNAMTANLKYFGIGQGERLVREKLSLGLTTKLNQFNFKKLKQFYNNLNQLVNLNSGGQLRFSGDVSKAMQSVSITAPVVNILANSSNSIFAQTPYLASAGD